MSKRKSPCKTGVKRDRGMWAATCTQHGQKHQLTRGIMQWYFSKKKAQEYVREHEALHAKNEGGENK